MMRERVEHKPSPAIMSPNQKFSPFSPPFFPHHILHPSSSSVFMTTSSYHSSFHQLLNDNRVSVSVLASMEQLGQKVRYQVAKDGAPDEQEDQEIILFNTSTFSSPSTSTDALFRLPRTPTNPTETSTSSPKSYRRHFLAFSNTQNSRFFFLSQQKEKIIIAVLAFVLLCFFIFMVHLGGRVSSLEDKLGRALANASTGKASGGYFPGTRFLLEKTRKALKSPVGVVITSNSAKAQEKKCKDGAPVFSARHPEHSDQLEINQNLMAPCDTKDNPTFWRMEAHKLYPVDESLSPSQKNMFCLMTFNELIDHLTVSVCNHKPLFREQFTVTVEAISVEKMRVYFAIRGRLHPEQCIGLHQDAQNGEMFRMETCRVHPSQLFYLDSVDYSKEFEEYEKLLWEELIE